MLDQGAAAAVQSPDVFIEQRSEARYSEIVERAVINFRGSDYAVPVVNIY